MKKLLFLCGFVVFLTGCAVTPDQGYSRSNAYYGPTYYYDHGYAGGYRYQQRMQPHPDQRWSKRPIPPKSDHREDRPSKPSPGNGQYRPVPPKNNNNGQHSQSRPTRPQQGNDQQRPQSRPTQPQRGESQHNKPSPNWNRGNIGQNKASQAQPERHPSRFSGR